MERVLRVLLRNGVRKGFFGGSRRWIVIGGVALGWRVLRKLSGEAPEVVYSERLLPGETVVIAHGREPR